MSKFANQDERKTVITDLTICHGQFVETVGKQFEDDAAVRVEHKSANGSHHIFDISQTKLLQNVHLNFGLCGIVLTRVDNFEGVQLAVRHILTSEHLSKRTATDSLDDAIVLHQIILSNDQIALPIIGKYTICILLLEKVDCNVSVQGT